MSVLRHRRLTTALLVLLTVVPSLASAQSAPAYVDAGSPTSAAMPAFRRLTAMPPSSFSPAF
ncbi:hypothetical protein AJ87_22255 [Rhizobium yanglingense]|nr:hypothetical protein AJ87_22255 [Rhizobium yanglingense]